eukprot:3854191-Rhodomonas_salina.2
MASWTLEGGREGGSGRGKRATGSALSSLNAQRWCCVGTQQRMSSTRVVEAKQEGLRARSLSDTRERGCQCWPEPERGNESRCHATSDQMNLDRTNCSAYLTN